MNPPSSSAPTAIAEPAPLRRVTVHDPFWDRYMRLVREKVLPYQWEALNDRVPGADPSHAIENFRIAAGLAEGEFHGYVFQDSDVAKWLEAVAYCLTTSPDPELEARADSVIELIGKAQQPDGYLDTYYIVAQPGKRWTDERRKHELYCAGHMIEAAVAYHAATGKRAFLEIVCRLVEHIASVFGTAPGQKRGYPGHQVIEMALVRLHAVTGDPRHLELAKYFIDERGQQPHYYDIEERERGESGHLGYYENYVYAYTQAHLPVREQDKAVGHAVRAMYLYCGMADVAMATSDAGLAKACATLWDNVTRRQMYVTGGIGASEYGEDFTFDYDLPNDLAYAETCASIGLVFFAQRMLRMAPRGEYGDVMERALYNGVLSGMALNGERFFYVNPLEVLPEACAKRHDHLHVEAQRRPWYPCACCPPNIARLLASLGGYLYSTNESCIWVHLFVGSTLAATVGGQAVRLHQSTEYPNGESTTLVLEGAAATRFTLALRLPGWCRNPSLSVNGTPVALPGLARDGYAYLERTWNPGDRVTLTLPMALERVHAHPLVRADAGRIALQRGPVVYCVEQVDNGASLASLVLPRAAKLEARFDPELLGGTHWIEAEGLRDQPSGQDAPLYAPEPPHPVTVRIRAVPYSLWGNREPGEMRVWIREN